MTRIGTLALLREVNAVLLKEWVEAPLIRTRLQAALRIKSTIALVNGLSPLRPGNRRPGGGLYNSKYSMSLGCIGRVRVPILPLVVALRSVTTPSTRSSVVSAKASLTRQAQ